MNSSGWDSRFAANPHHFGAGPNTLLEKHVADLAPGTAADVGCGQGRNTAWLASRGWHVTAVDYSTVGLEHTREATAAALGAAAESVGATEAAGAASPAAVDDLLTTVHSDVMEWEPGTTFDLVVAAYLHMPSSDMRVLWRRLADATAPGGTLVVVGHDTDNAGGVHLDDVDMAAFHDRFTVDAGYCEVDGGLVGRVTLVVERTCQNTRCRGLADPANAGQHPCLRDAACRKSVGERPDHWLLANQSRKITWAVFASQHTVGGGSARVVFCAGVHSLEPAPCFGTLVWLERRVSLARAGGVKCPFVVRPAASGACRLKGGRLAR